MKISDKKIDDETINCNLKFIDSFLFMNSSLDSLVINLSEINNKTCIPCEETNKITKYCEFVKLNESRFM